MPGPQECSRLVIESWPGLSRISLHRCTTEGARGVQPSSIFIDTHALNLFEAEANTDDALLTMIYPDSRSDCSSSAITTSIVSNIFSFSFIRSPLSIPDFQGVPSQKPNLCLK